MQITIDLPDALQISEADLRTELAGSLCCAVGNALFQQKNIILIEQAAQLAQMDVDDFYDLLVERQILTRPSDPDDDPDELILAHLRISLQDVKEGRTSPISELWDGIDV